MMQPRDRSPGAATESAADNTPSAAPATAAPQPEGSPTSPASEDRIYPATEPRLTLRELFAELRRTVSRAEVSGRSTQFAYSLVFATFPLLVVVMSLAAFLQRTFGLDIADTLKDAIDSSAPMALKPLLDQLVDRAIVESSAQTASVGGLVATVLAVFGAAGAAGSVVGSCARAYGVRTSRSILTSRLVNALLAIVTILLIVVAAVLQIFGEQIVTWLIDQLNAGSTVTSLVKYGRWSLAYSLVLFALLALYRIGPQLDLSLRWLLPGAILSTGMWFLLLQGFSTILRVTNPGNPYGALSNLIVLLYFFYLTGFIFLLGSVVNSILGHRYDERVRADLARHPEKRLFCDDGREVG
jgi:membrane protein